MKINKKIIAKLNPCKDRFDNYVEHYKDKTFDVSEFIDLDKISHSDKLWVLLRLAKRENIKVFALDCAVDAYSADYAAWAANTATSDVYSATYDAAASDAAHAAKQKKQQEQLECLLWLIQNEGK